MCVHAGCPYEGQVFFDREKGECRPCVGTCKNPAPIPCRQCSGGCGCPEGTVTKYSGSKVCLKPEQCPYCIPGTTFVDPCKRWLVHNAVYCT